MREILIEDYSYIRESDKAVMRIKTYKGKGKIRVQLFCDSILVQENTSPRPYELGQNCDGTIDNCALAAYFVFCADHDINGFELLAESYPNEEWIDNNEFFNELMLRGMAEGVELPHKWTDKSAGLLLESLTEINYHQLRNCLQEKMEDLGFQNL